MKRRGFAPWDESDRKMQSMHGQGGSGLLQPIERAVGAGQVLAAGSHPSGCGPKGRTGYPPKWLASCLLAACLASVPRPAFAQMDLSSHVMETQDETPPEKLPVPQKMTGIGNVHMQITAKPEAQMWFNQGLNLIYDF